MSVAVVGALTGILVPIGVFAMVVLLVWMRHRSNEVEAKTRAETQKHFLDKFGSGRELAEFIDSENGKRFLDELSKRRADPMDRFFEHRNRPFRLVTPGIVLTVAGLGMLVIAMTQEDDMAAPAVVTLSIGIGLLISVGVTGRMAKKADLEGSQARQAETH